MENIIKKSGIILFYFVKVLSICFEFGIMQRVSPKINTHNTTVGTVTYFSSKILVLELKKIVFFIYTAFGKVYDYPV